MAKKLLTPVDLTAVPGGTAPLLLTSTTLVNNLNADLLDGQHGSYYADIPGRLGYTPVNLAGDTMTGPLHVDTGGEAPKIIVERNDAASNVSIEYRATGGSVFAGYGYSDEFRIGSAQDLAVANAFFRVGASKFQRVIGGTSYDIWHAGNFTPGDYLTTAAAAAGYVAKANGVQSLTATTDWRIAASTAEASDTLQMRFVAGGAFSTARGAILELNGVNSAGSNAGGFRLLGNGPSAVTMGAHEVTFSISTYNFTGPLQYGGVLVATQARDLIAGNGLTGGGTLAADRTFTLGTPGTLTGTSTNAVTTTSHTHALSGVALLSASNTFSQTQTVDTGGIGDYQIDVSGVQKGGIFADATRIALYGASGSTLYLRPNGRAATSGMATLDASGNFSVPGTLSDSKGDVRDVIGVTRNSTTAFSAADAGKAIVKTTATARTWAVNTGVWYYGMTVTVINDNAAGNVTISQGTGMTLLNGNTTGNFILLPGESRTLYGLSTTRVKVL